jgi:putrescine transport system substrate-binding protein
LAPCGITMMDSAIDVIPSVLRWLGRAPDSTEARDLADVEKTLMAIRPYIRTFASGGAVEALAAGQTCLVMSYSGDVIQAAARAREAGQAEVRYVAPKEFAQLWFDMLAMPADAPHAAEGRALIAFLLRPEIMAAITNKVRYPNAVPASWPAVEAAVRDDRNVFPDVADPRFYTTTASAAAGADRARTRLWARFKAGQ